MSKEERKMTKGREGSKAGAKTREGEGETGNTEMEPKSE